MNLFLSPVLKYNRFDALALLTEFLAPLQTEDGRTIIKDTVSD